MAEYIERENYCENVCHCANEYCDKESCPIWKAPVADVAAVRHGRWEDRQGGFWGVAMCSVCGEKFPTGEIGLNYCPNCGAKMDGEDGDGND